MSIKLMGRVKPEPVTPTAEPQGRLQRALAHANDAKYAFEQMANIFSVFTHDATNGANYAEKFRKDIIGGLQEAGVPIEQVGPAIEEALAEYIPEKHRAAAAE